MSDQHDTEETLQVEGGVPPEEEPKPEVAPEDQEPEETEEIEGKGKMVPLAALQAIRKELKELKPKAAEAEQLRTYVNESRPYIDFLRNNPDLLKPRQQQPQQPDPAVQQAVDRESEEVARRYDLYTPEGKLDLKRAQAIVQDNRRIAREEAQRAMQPFQQQTMAQRAEANLREAIAAKDPYGRQIEEKYLAMAIGPLMENVPRERTVEMLSDPKVVKMLTREAAMMQIEARPHVSAPTEQPLFTESQGGQQSYVMSDIEKRLARDANIKEKDWARTAKKFVPGRPISLED